MSKTKREITKLSLLIAIIAVAFTLTNCGTQNPYAGIWVSNVSPDYIIIDNNSNMTFIKGAYIFDDSYTVAEGSYISSVDYGTFEDNTILIDKTYKCDSETKVYELSNIPKNEAVDLPSRQAIVVEFESDYVFKYKQGMYSYKFTKQNDDYQIKFNPPQDTNETK